MYESQNTSSYCQPCNKAPLLSLPDCISTQRQGLLEIDLPPVHIEEDSALATSVVSIGGYS